MGRIVVTGSSGLLGRHVARRLADGGHEVVGLDRTPAPAGAPWTHVTGDAGDLAVTAGVVAGADAVVHIAAIPRPTGRAAVDVFRANMAAAFAAIEAARLAGVRRFVYASSFSVYGFPFFDRDIRPSFLPLDESHPIGAQDVYATTKWLGEEMVGAAVRRGAFTAVSLRMPWVQTPESFHREVGPRRSGPDAARDLFAYVDARDAAEAFRAAVETTAVSGHARLLVAAADSYADEPTEALVNRFYPGVPWRGGADPFGGLLDWSAARSTLGYTPRHSWRDYPPPSAV